ncbi:MAG: radical SAM protein [SAR324 cluster bacterium]|nr:radical SAM protein [SAR324 cluster bacterium]
MNVVLISTYELGRQPFGLASPAAWLRKNGYEVDCADAAVADLPEDRIRRADLIAFYVPMHTATRLTIKYLPFVQALAPHAHLCCYGLYAPLNQSYLQRLGVNTLLGGEFEEGLLELCQRLTNEHFQQEESAQNASRISLARQQFLLPDRTDLPALNQYAHLVGEDQGTRLVGSVEASRGCKHRCRHCPIVPVYQGKFRVVQREIVLADIRQQAAAGAKHITFGDPDFFNGIGHALPLIHSLHAEFPELSYDVTIKIEHLLKHADALVHLKESGCLFVTSAVESVDDSILSILNKNHTYKDFTRVVHMFEELDLALNPTFLPFTPWTTLAGYQKLLTSIIKLKLVEHVAPIQLAIRLLIPEGSELLDLAERDASVEKFDEATLAYPWHHLDPRVDELHFEILELVNSGTEKQASRQEIFTSVWNCAHRKLQVFHPLPEPPAPALKTAFPYLSETWYC